MNMNAVRFVVFAAHPYVLFLWGFLMGVLLAYVVRRVWVLYRFLHSQRDREAQILRETHSAAAALGVHHE